MKHLFLSESNFPPEEIKEIISKKGFFVYEYISIIELIKTLQKDYLLIMSKINFIFSFLVILVFFLSSIYNTIFFILLVYIIIFLIITIKFSTRIQHYFDVSNVIFTKEGIILGNKIISYKNKNLDPHLKFYENIFSEYLTKTSKINNIISRKKIELFNKTKRMLKNRDPKHSQIQIVLLAYGISIYIFYYLGILIGFTVFFIFGILVNFINEIKKNTELKIKILMEKIDKDCNKLNIIADDIVKKIDNFLDGNINNLENLISDNFGYLFVKIYSITNKKNQLENIIKHSNYKNFIDFSIFKLYIKNQYNTPLLKLQQLLKSQLNKITNQIKIIKDQLETSKEKEYKLQLENKINQLEKMNIIIIENHGKIEELVMK